jgi:hypothetical protein
MCHPALATPARTALLAALAACGLTATQGAAVRTVAEAVAAVAKLAASL